MSFEVQDFDRQVLARSHTVPVVVDFWAPWCGPCRSLGPILEELARGADDRWELVKVNTDEHPELASAFGIASIPAVKLFVKGEVVDEFVGALPRREVQRWLDRALPSPRAPQLEVARTLLEEGKTAEAARVLESVLAGEPGNHEARLGLARAVLGSTPERVEALLEPIGEDAEWASTAGALRTLARVLLRAGTLPGLPDGPARESYLSGAAAVRRGDWDAALQGFLGVLERQKDYDHGSAREACRAIFQLLGPRHPAVERHFRAFSSALHA